MCLLLYMQSSRCFFLFVFAMCALVFSAPGQDLDFGPPPSLPTNEANPDGADIQGLVIESDSGEPATGITVLLEVYDMRIRREVGMERTETDLQGRFSFNLTEYAEIPRFGLEFMTLSPRYQQASRISTINREELPLAMKLEVYPGVAARGILRDPAGNPVEGAEIYGPMSQATTTNEEGRFEIFGLPPGRYVTFAVEKDGYSRLEKSLSMPAEDALEGLEWEIQPSAPLRGQVKDTQGNPVTGGTAYLQVGPNRYLQQRLDDEGRFVLEGAPVDVDGMAFTLLLDEYSKIERPVTAREEETREMILRPSRRLALAGQITGPDGKPAAGVEVFLGDGVDDPLLRFATDAQGRWEATPLIPARDYVVSVIPSVPEGRRAMGELQFLGKNEEGQLIAEVRPWPGGYESDFVVQRDGNEVTMTRRDSGIGALPGAIVYEGTFEPEKGEITGTLTVEATGAEGEFTARAYGLGNKLVGVWDLRESLGEGEHYLGPAQKRVDGAPFPGTQIVDFVLPEPMTLSGRVLDSQGVPISEGEVVADNWNQTDVLTRRTPINAGGEFELEGLPDGVFHVYAVGPEGGRITNPIYLRGGLEGITIQQTKERQDPLETIE